MTWTLIILWANGLMQEYTGIESEELCHGINTEIRRLITDPELLNPVWACVPGDEHE